MRRARPAVLSVLVLLAACGGREPPRPPSTVAAEEAKPETPPEDEPEEETGPPTHIVYDQILIAFKGSYRVKNPRTHQEEILSDTDRPQEAAKVLAAKVLDLARSGGDFEALKDAYSDARIKDGSASGEIHAALDGVPKDTREIYRSTLYPGPASVVFNLKKDEISMIEYDPKRCPDGWLIVKRVK
ncbi:MAG TPA: hypothetical protein VFY93_09925 [Planctomycetota bacterium]|nr:hypothetical protein [Planctomycetota bacterium]